MPRLSRVGSGRCNHSHHHPAHAGSRAQQEEMTTVTSDPVLCVTRLSVSAAVCLCVCPTILNVCIIIIILVLTHVNIIIFPV